MKFFPHLHDHLNVYGETFSTIPGFPGVFLVSFLVLLCWFSVAHHQELTLSTGSEVLWTRSLLLGYFQSWLECFTEKLWFSQISLRNLYVTALFYFALFHCVPAWMDCLPTRRQINQALTWSLKEYRTLSRTPLWLQTQLRTCCQGRLRSSLLTRRGPNSVNWTWWPRLTSLFHKGARTPPVYVLLLLTWRNPITLICNALVMPRWTPHGDSAARHHGTAPGLGDATSVLSAPSVPFPTFEGPVRAPVGPRFNVPPPGHYYMPPPMAWSWPGRGWAIPVMTIPLFSSVAHSLRHPTASSGFLDSVPFTGLHLPFQSPTPGRTSSARVPWAVTRPALLRPVSSSQRSLYLLPEPLQISSKAWWACHPLGLLSRRQHFLRKRLSSRSVSQSQFYRFHECNIVGIYKPGNLRCDTHHTKYMIIGSHTWVLCNFGPKSFHVRPVLISGLAYLCCSSVFQTRSCFFRPEVMSFWP